MDAKPDRRRVQTVPADAGEERAELVRAFRENSRRIEAEQKRRGVTKQQRDAALRELRRERRSKRRG